MVALFKKNAVVQVKQKEFVSLILELNTTIENRLQYVDDPVTEATWKDLVCNGIKKQELLTVTDVAHMLDMTDQNTMQLAPVINTLFTTIPVLRHYWSIEKLNTQSVWIKRLPNVNIRDLHNKLKSPSQDHKEKVQTTLIQMQDRTKSSDNSMKQDMNDKDDGFIVPKKTINLENVKTVVDEVKNTHNKLLFFFLVKI